MVFLLRDSFLLHLLRRLIFVLQLVPVFGGPSHSKVGVVPVQVSSVPVAIYFEGDDAWTFLVCRRSSDLISLVMANLVPFGYGALAPVQKSHFYIPCFKRDCNFSREAPD